MSAANHRMAPAPLAAPATNGAAAPHAYAHDDPPLNNGHHHHHHHHHSHHAAPPQDHRSAPTPPPMTSGSGAKKAKGKKAMDSNEASKLVAARISQLEVDTAAEKEQEIEIEREVRKANRELSSQMSKMSDMDKIDHLTKRSSDLFASMKRLERDNIKNKKRADQLQKEKDSSRTDLSKQIGLKEKLEKLCRELQKENNKLKNEHRALNDTHDRLKTSSDDRFKKVLETLEGYQEDKDNPRKQIVYMKAEELFKARFKSLIDQYELRELHFHSAMRTKELEVQWNMARFEQQKKATETEACRSRQLNSQVLTFTKTETELRSQLNVYVEKFKQVEDTLNNSNDLFLTFRKEMEDMSRKTKKLEKENDNYRKRQDALNQNIVHLVGQRERHRDDIVDMRKKNEKLSGIIGQMQQQGRGIPAGLQATVNSCLNASRELEMESAVEVMEAHEAVRDHHKFRAQLDEDDDDEDEDEEDEDSEEGEFDDDTEEELMPATVPALVCGPERPPPPAHVATTNGHR